MKKLFLLSALTMTACAPIAQLAQPGEAAQLTQDSLSLLIANPGPDSLTGDLARNQPGGVLTVDGVGLVPDAQAAQWCKFSTRWDCAVPEIAASQRLRVTFSSGVINDAIFTGYRASKGAVPVVSPLK